MNHNELVVRAGRWLRNTVGCGFAFEEFSCGMTTEQPDAIGFKQGCSYLIECKTSRADFHSDKKKWPRRHPSHGMGDWRFYMAPSGLLRVADMPEGWHLLEVHGRSIRWGTPKPKGFPWGTPPFWDNTNKTAETGMMYSALRRLHMRGRLDEIYTPVGEAVLVND